MQIDANGYYALANQHSYVSISSGKFACHSVRVCVFFSCSYRRRHIGLGNTAAAHHTHTHARGAICERRDTSKKKRTKPELALEFIAFSESRVIHTRILMLMLMLLLGAAYTAVLVVYLVPTRLPNNQDAYARLR